MAAIARHSTVGCFARKSSGTFFVASPMISKLRTNARQRVSSAAKALYDSPALCAMS